MKGLKVSDRGQHNKRHKYGSGRWQREYVINNGNILTVMTNNLMACMTKTKNQTGSYSPNNLESQLSKSQIQHLSTKYAYQRGGL